MAIIETMLERRNREVFTAKSVAEKVDVEVIIKDKHGRIMKKSFKDCIFDETAATFEHDAEYLELDLTFKGESKNFSQEFIMKNNGDKSE